MGRGRRGLAVVMAGGWLGIATLKRHGAAPPSERLRDPGLGDRVITGFGSLSVDSVEQLVGPSSAMHLRAPGGTMPVQVAVTFNNLGRRTLTYDPRWFRLIGAGTSAAVGWSSRPRRVPALRAQRVVLRFAVPAGPMPRLEFRGPGRRGAVRVDLGDGSDLPTFNPATHAHGG